MREQSPRCPWRLGGPNGLVFPLSSGIEKEGHGDDEDGNDRDGASEAGPEVAMMECAEDVTPVEVARARS